MDDQDCAWLAGISAASGKTSLNYNYRDMDENSTVAFFSDSTFAASHISSGHKIGVKFNFTKNVSLGLTSNLATRYNGVEQDLFLLDGVIRF